MSPQGSKGKKMAEGSKATTQPSCWAPSPHALERAQQVYLQDLPTMDLVGLTGWLTAQLQRGGSDDRADCRVYADALYDMSRLIDELRFEASLAAVYLMDFGHKLESKEPALGERAGIFKVPGTAIALLSPPLGDKPFFSKLFSDPATPLAGHRVLAGWLTAQLLDSALMRSVAALDCVAILLCSAAGSPFAVDSQDNLLLPSFCRNDLDLIGAHYGSNPVWPNLYKLTEHRCIKMARPYRHGFIHRRRAATELHGGAEVIVTFGGDSAMPTLGRLDQLSMVRDFYREVLHVAAELAGELLRPRGVDRRD